MWPPHNYDQFSSDAIFDLAVKVNYIQHVWFLLLERKVQLPLKLTTYRPDTSRLKYKTASTNAGLWTSYYTVAYNPPHVARAHHFVDSGMSQMKISADHIQLLIRRTMCSCSPPGTVGAVGSTNFLTRTNLLYIYFLSQFSDFSVCVTITQNLMEIPEFLHRPSVTNFAF